MSTTSENYALYATLLSTGIGVATGIANYFWASSKTYKSRKSIRTANAFVGGSLTGLSVLALGAFYKNPQQNCEQLPISVVFGTGAYMVMSEDEFDK
jgi:hypothetical protein